MVKIGMVICVVIGMFYITFTIFTTKSYLKGSMDIASYSGKWKRNSGSSYYALQYVVYCENPIDIQRQCLSIYVPDAYLNADGSVNPDGKAGKHTAATAPILYINRVSGYFEVPSAMLIFPNKDYLKQGYVLVYPASRGITTKAKDGSYIGRSPEALVDLKAGIRFIKANADNLPGDTNRIFSIGSSAGGAMSSLLGVTGNSERYTPYLEAIGAMMDSADDVYASVCYCPITDLEHADLGYEWMFGADESKLKTGFLKDLSSILARDYTGYVNSLKLLDPQTGESLTLNEDGRSGSFHDYLLEKLNKTASAHFNANGHNENYPWLTWDGDAARIADFDGFIQGYNKRMKGCTSFDTLAMSSPENQALAGADEKATHFNEYIVPALEKLNGKYPAEREKYYGAYAAALNDGELNKRKKLYNPLSFIGTVEKSDVAPHFRIRVGTKDNHTAFTVSLILALKLLETGSVDVDQEYVWGADHGGVAKADTELTDWIDSICQQDM
ncbi:MAG: hypothetical protein LBH85_07515 [Treponema sp.]|nr:hypothetical protein [Treponema sp.]